MKAASGANPRYQAFGYVCRHCSRCCHHYDVQVNPYEVARLARRIGTTTTAFRATSTRDGAGTALKRTDAGACVFLGTAGCTVYADRPLVCRLYPLGRRLTPEGAESFVQFEGLPQSAGEFTNTGTIEGFLESQGVAPFIEAADEYYHWVLRAHDSVGPDASLGPSEPPPETGTTAPDLIHIDTPITR